MPAAYCYDVLVCHGVEKRLPSRLQFTLVSAETSVRLASSIPSFQHRTWDQYQAEIGRKEFAIETDFENLLGP